MKQNYYVRLNESNIGIEIVTRPTKLPETQGYIPIPDYNEMYLYRKYDPVTQWSQETYEPSIDTQLQDKVAGFEELVVEQNKTISDLSTINTQLLVQTASLQGAIMELTMIISMMIPTGGAE